MPLSITVPRRRVREVVLPTQLIGDAGGSRVQVGRVPDNLGAATAVIGQVPQRGDVDPVVATDGAPAGSRDGEG